MIKSKKIVLDSKGNFYSINISNRVEEYISSTGIQNGHIVLYYQHTSGSIVIFEQEAGVMVDIEDAFDRLFPKEIEYKHHMREVDDNGASHVRSLFLCPSITIPIIDGELALGKYQEIVIIDMQPQAKPRTLILQVAGE
jgi:secondary thiamine-phosphate synthase enzyme